MSKFRKSPRPKVPSINTASLPDLVFTLLFFFLLVTNIKGNGPMVDVKEPDASEYSELDNNTLYSTIYIGVPFQAHQQEQGAETRIQVDDRWMEAHEISPYFVRKMASLSPGEQAQMSVFIRADKEVAMKTIEDVEHALREARILKINYAVADNEATNKRE